MPRRATSGSFKPGKSGNPGGRPKEIAEVREAAAAHTLDAIERLAFWMRSKEAKASVQAANSLLDRAWGRPMQSVEAKVESSGTYVIGGSPMSDEEWAETYGASE